MSSISSSVKWQTTLPHRVPLERTESIAAPGCESYRLTARETAIVERRDH